MCISDNAVLGLGMSDDESAASDDNLGDNVGGRVALCGKDNVNGAAACDDTLTLVKDLGRCRGAVRRCCEPQCSNYRL